MISSPQPNKATPNSDPHEDEHSTTKINEQLLPYHQEELDVNEPHSRQDAENLVRNGQKPKAHQEVPRRPQGLSLKNKATALAIALGTLPLLLIGATAYYFADRTLVKEVNQEKRERATNAANEINRFMFERYGDIQIMANLPTLRNPKVRAATTPQEKQAALNRFLDAYGVYDSIAVADLAGNTIVQSLGEPVTGLGERDYFKEVIKTNSPVIIPPRQSALTGEYSVFMAAPIVDSATGKTIGVIRSRLPMKFVEEIIGNLGTSGDKYHLFDASGKYFLISGGDQKLVGKEAKADFPGLTQLQAPRKVASQVMTNSQNAKELVAYAPFQKLAGFPDLNWNVILTTDTAIAFAAQKQLLLTLAIGTALTALLVSAIAAYPANRATRPIVDAAGAVEKLGQGELDTRIAVKGQDELAMLGFNINRMAGQMQSLLQGQEAETKRAGQTKDITFHLSQSVNPEIIFNTAVEEIRHALKTDRVVVYAFNEIWQGTVIAESVDEKWPRAMGAKIDDPCFAKQYVDKVSPGTCPIH